MRCRLGTSGARGYCGWHTTWDNKQCYLRSLGEYVVACMLDTMHLPYLTEMIVYNISEYKYKPDFFIYTDTTYTKFTEIIEVKGQGESEKAKLYMDRYSNYFEMNYIKYKVIYQFDALKTKYCPKSKQDEWRNKTKDLSNILSGALNPMYGKKQKESTKLLIGKKAKERNNDPNYVAKCKTSQKIYWESERSAAQKLAISECRHKEVEARRKKYLALPDIITKCLWCGNDSVGKTEILFCDNKCKRKWNQANVVSYGMHANPLTGHQRRLKTYIHEICKFYNISINEFFTNTDGYVLRAKQDKIIPLNKGLGVNTLIKYNLTKESSIWQN